MLFNIVDCWFWLAVQMMKLLVLEAPTTEKNTHAMTMTTDETETTDVTKTTDATGTTDATKTTDVARKSATASDGETASSVAAVGTKNLPVVQSMTETGKFSLFSLTYRVLIEYCILFLKILYFFLTLLKLRGARQPICPLAAF